MGGLVGLGIPEIEAKRYEEKLRTGNYLIAVHAEGDREDRFPTPRRGDAIIYKCVPGGDGTVFKSGTKS